MKKIFAITLLITALAIPVFAAVLQSGVEVKHIPKSFYGSWRVASELTSTNNSALFKKKNTDFWNISRINDVIKLENPFSGASQTVIVKDINNNFIKFTKIGNYSGKKLTDEVTLTLEKEIFYGVNELRLDTISDIDGHVIKTDWATYKIRGEKLSGTSLED